MYASWSLSMAVGERVKEMVERERERRMQAPGRALQHACRGLRARHPTLLRSSPNPTWPAWAAPTQAPAQHLRHDTATYLTGIAVQYGCAWYCYEASGSSLNHSAESSISKQLVDKMYEKRKAAALELEKLVLGGILQPGGASR